MLNIHFFPSLFFSLSGRYCGTTMPHPITSFGNALVVNFISNNNITARGFHATYAASSSCKSIQQVLLPCAFKFYEKEWIPYLFSSLPFDF